MAMGKGVGRVPIHPQGRTNCRGILVRLMGQVRIPLPVACHVVIIFPNGEPKPKQV